MVQTGIYALSAARQQIRWNEVDITAHPRELSKQTQMMTMMMIDDHNHETDFTYFVKLQSITTEGHV